VTGFASFIASETVRLEKLMEIASDASVFIAVAQPEREGVNLIPT
jgi:hypothetical protein